MGYLSSLRLLSALAILSLFASPPVTARQYTDGGDEYHRPSKGKSEQIKNLNPAEINGEYWVKEAQDALRARMAGPMNTRVAKNVIMFLGDGMSITTLAAARTLLGQRDDRPGEESKLSFEEFPVVGLAKTYCVDYQIPDSACTATAYLCGVKNNYETVGVDARVPRRDCVASTNKLTHVESIAAWALKDGRDAGIVTNTRLTHASPSGVYAHAAYRGWENDAEVRRHADPALCPDIADQLITQFPGKDLKVILGGGRRNFLPISAQHDGRRLDGRDLIEEWKNDKNTRNVKHKYVSTLNELRDLDLTDTDYLLGIFDEGHLPYHLQSNPEVDPALDELTETAIRMLSQNDTGYFLFVEGGRIDHAHHENWVGLSLDETIEFSKAIARAVEMTDREDTLIVVTSDHSHVMAFNGYSPRGHDILGQARQTDDHGVPYMTLSYTNGPGFRPHTAEGIRADVTKEENFRDLEWTSHVELPRNSETHGGDDVAVFALGPQQHVFTGVYEQSQLPHLMGYASCLGPGLHAAQCSAAPHVAASLLLHAILATVMAVLTLGRIL